MSTKEYLEEYFHRSRKVFDAHRDDNLYLLCIQCFEVFSLAMLDYVHNVLFNRMHCIRSIAI